MKMTSGKWDMANFTEAGPGSSIGHIGILDALGYSGPMKVQFPASSTGSMAQAYAKAQKGRHQLPSQQAPTPGGAGARGNPASGGATSKGANVSLGQKMAAKMGWTGAEWNALNQLWTRESGWSNTAKNSSSGAYGIAQALGHGPTNQYPSGRYASANPPPYGSSNAAAQIAWGLWYIKTRYGSPSNALAHENRFNWY